MIFDILTTEIFTINATKFASIEGRRLLFRWLWLPVVAAIILAVIGLTDARYAFVALIVLLVVCPMIFSLAWFSLIGKRQVAKFTHPQRWTFCDDKIVVELFHFEQTDDSVPFENVEIPRTQISDVDFSSNPVIVRLLPQTNMPSFLLIPQNLFPQTFIKDYDSDSSTQL